jgi:hypothetical protein
MTNETRANKDSNVHNDTERYQPQAEVDVPGLRVDLGKDIPVAAPVAAVRESANKFNDSGKEYDPGSGKAGSAEHDQTELTNIGASLGEIGLTGVAFAMDPMNFLISAGLGFLIDVIQPLDDLIGLVTGNAERMEGEIAKWERVGNALEPLSEEVRAAADKGLITWNGKAGDAAKNRLGEFADGVAGVAADVKLVTRVMDMAKMIAEALREFIVSLVATFVQWLVVTWLAALAAAPVTAGASTAAAGATTAAQTAVTLSRGVRMMDKVAKVYKRVGTVLKKVNSRSLDRVDKPFRELAKDPNTYAPGLAKVAATSLNYHKKKDQHDTSEHDYSPEEQRKKLDLAR